MDMFAWLVEVLGLCNVQPVPDIMRASEWRKCRSAMATLLVAAQSMYLLLPLIALPVAEVSILLAESVAVVGYVQAATAEEVSSEIPAIIQGRILSLGLTVLPAMEIKDVSIVMVQVGNNITNILNYEIKKK